MTPQEAVRLLVSLIPSAEEPSIEEIYTAMNRSGLGVDDADRAFKFTQIAFGRHFLDGMGIRFPAEYYWLDAGGSVIDSGLLDEEPHYAAAAALAPSVTQTAAFMRLALTSADVQTVNELLKKGSKPQDIVAAPPLLFRDSPSPQGLQKADELLASLLRRQTSPPVGRKKAWWQFWA